MQLRNLALSTLLDGAVRYARVVGFEELEGAAQGGHRVVDATGAQVGSPQEVEGVALGPGVSGHHLQGRDGLFVPSLVDQGHPQVEIGAEVVGHDLELGLEMLDGRR